MDPEEEFIKDKKVWFKSFDDLTKKSDDNMPKSSSDSDGDSVKSSDSTEDSDSEKEISKGEIDLSSDDNLSDSDDDFIKNLPKLQMDLNPSDSLDKQEIDLPVIDTEFSKPIKKLEIDFSEFVSGGFLTKILRIFFSSK